MVTRQASTILRRGTTRALLMAAALAIAPGALAAQTWSIDLDRLTALARSVENLGAQLEGLAALRFHDVGVATFLTLPSPESRVPSPEVVQGDSLYRAAQDAMNSGDYRRAASLFSQVIDRYPRSSVVPQAHYLRAFSLFRAGGSENLRTALSAVDVLLDRYPDEARRNDASALRVRICGELAQRGDAQCARQVSAAAQGDTARACPSADDETDVRIMAINALMQMNAADAVPVLERVLARRDACSVGLRRKAVFILSQKRDSRTADILLASAREDPDAEVREQAIFWLGNVRDPRVVDLLADMARNSSDPKAQERALFALTQTRSERAGQVLREVAQDERASDDARRQAVFWLGQRRDADTRDFLRNLYGRTTDRGMKETILQQLAQQRDSATTQWIIGIALNDRESMEARKQALFWAGQQRGLTVQDLGSIYDRVNDREMKEQVLFVLSQRRDSVAVDKLMDIARRDPDQKLRQNAIFWLGQRRDPRIIKFLEELINKQ